MPMPLPFPADPQLTAISLAYINTKYIADSIMPRIGVSTPAFRYRKYDKATYLTPASTMVGRKGEPNEVELGFTEDSDYVLDYGLDDIIPNL
ncbi:phage capsid protein, partial [bacterium]|nr:phage capsid protein [bacterium]